jgi:hypothetical protein
MRGYFHHETWRNHNSLTKEAVEGNLVLKKGKGVQGKSLHAKPRKRTC